MNKEIKKRLIDLNLSITGLSKVVGYSFAYTYRVLSGREKSLRARKRIAAKLGMTIEELWPEGSLPIKEEFDKGESS